MLSSTAPRRFSGSEKHLQRRAPAGSARVRIGRGGVGPGGGHLGSELRTGQDGARRDATSVLPGAAFLSGGGVHRPAGDPQAHTFEQTWMAGGLRGGTPVVRRVRPADDWTAHHVSGISGFLTSLYVIMVPIMLGLGLGRWPSPMVGAGVIIVVGGWRFFFCMGR